MAGTNVPTVPTVPVRITSNTSAVPVTYWYRDIEWLVFDQVLVGLSPAITSLYIVIVKSHTIKFTIKDGWIDDVTLYELLWIFYRKTNENKYRAIFKKKPQITPM